MDKERPNVLIVVGAGISVGATAAPSASWLGLLEHGIETLRGSGVWNAETANANLTLLKNAFSSNFDLDEVLGRAESIARALGAPNGTKYGEWLAQAIGTLEARKDRISALNAIKQLEQAGALILTTNYDDLLGDVTGLEPVTWQDHREFLRVLNREREGILHLHGHWRMPSSVILGRGSYEKIVATTELQEIFKSIWMHWSWLYVGCGNGLDDPNVGRLLRWGQSTFAESGRKQFFLTKEDAAAGLSARMDKPANLIPVGYPDHSDLPKYLEWLTPRRRHSPFIELGPFSGPVRLPTTSPSDIPLPSWKELIAGEVPPLAVDAAVSTALSMHGWALVYDVASVGKTTLALRLAAAAANIHGRPAFYLDMARIDVADEDESARIRASVRRLANTKALVIIDNAHWAPQLTRDLWEWWLDRPRKSQFLMAATRIQHTAGMAGDDGLALIEQHLGNPAIALRLVPLDLLPVLNSIIKRVSGHGAALRPTNAVLEEWHTTFANEMGAFAAAVTNLHHLLTRGEWTLPITAAAEWMQKRHFSKLGNEERENLIFLSVFAAQALEMEVHEPALPHPDKMTTLLKNGLVERRELGRRRYRAYILREPDWGPLLLAASADLQPDTDKLLMTAARRDATLAITLSSRLALRHDRRRQALLWKTLLSQEAVAQFAEQLTKISLSFAGSALIHVALHVEASLIDGLWRALEQDQHRLAQQAFTTQLGHLASFIDIASAQNRASLVDSLWQALEQDPLRLAQSVFDTPLDHFVGFIDKASAQNRVSLVDSLWQALEQDPHRLARQAFDTPLHFLVGFIDKASVQNRISLVDRLWQALEQDPHRLAQQAFDTQLGYLASFIDKASAQNRASLVDSLWPALEQDPHRLAQQAFATQLGHLASFIAIASAQNRGSLLGCLWEALEQNPHRLAQQAFATQLGHLASFIDIASAQNRASLVDSLWQALEQDPHRLARQVFDTPLHFLVSFIDKASAQNRVSLVDSLWQALEQDPHRLQVSAAQLPGIPLLGFLKRAPEAIAHITIAKLSVDDWASGNRVPRPFWGAPRLAEKFSAFGREDLASALRNLLLHTQDKRWFSAPYAALMDVAILLSDLSDSEQMHVDSFISRVCSQRWLNTQYLGKTNDSTLSRSLVQLAMTQPTSVIRRFWAPSLRARIASGIAKIENTEGEALSEIIQFLGAVQLVGQRLPKVAIEVAKVEGIARLPLDVLPHRPDVAGIEPNQLNLWLGLRVIASITTARLRVGQAVIDETLERWRSGMNLVEQSRRQSHSLTNSMCKWLEASSRDGRGLLLPSREPLWMAAGFEREPGFG